MTAYRVLIVDDSRFMRQVLSDVVNTDDAFTVTAVASNGEEAVQLALELKPDLIIMDLEMPRMNGLEALQQVMAVRPAPVIMMSAVTDNGTRDTIKALQYGAFDFIRKPDKALQLDILEVSEYLLEKLHAAAASLGQGAFRVMPALEEQEQAAAREPEIPHVKDEPPSAGKQTDLSPPGGSGTGSGQDPPQERKAPEALRLRIQKDDGKDSTSGPARSAPLTKPGRRIEAKSVPPAYKPSNQPLSPSQPNQPPVRPKVTDLTVKRSKTAPGSEKLYRPDPDETAVTSAAAPSQTTNLKTDARQDRSEFKQIVVVGTSTGGPRALHEVLAKLPKDFEAPVLVVQHMPPKFTQSLAQRLDSYCALKVREAEQGDLIESGTVYIAPGGWHMRLHREPSGKYRIKLTNEGPRNGHMPSVDVLFESLVGHRELKRHAVLMTGMGSDGAAGMQKLQQDGTETRIAQSQETCIVYGMPGSAVKLGAINHIIPLQQIATVLVREVRAHSK